jgi:hypothetical protein
VDSAVAIQQSPYVAERLRQDHGTRETGPAAIEVFTFPESDQGFGHFNQILPGGLPPSYSL